MCAVVGTIMPNMARAEEAARLTAAAETPVRVKWSRIAGQNRYETAAAIVGAGFDKSVAVVVASGENYPDALAASALAGVLSAPVVLTAHGMLTQESSARIESLGATTALVVGGTSAVSGSVFEQLSKMGLKTMRVEGSTRCNTAVAAMTVPIMYTAATQLGHDPLPFLIALLMAVGSSLVTPIGSSTNMLVYGPGGYRFGDFVRIGLPVKIVFLVVSIFFINIIYPLNQ
jgi:hypothetical protein